MEEKVEKQEGINLKAIFKLLLKKIKLLLLVLLAGVVVGAGFGFLTNFNKKYYGTYVEFYVNPVPTEEHVESDSYFAVNGTYTRNVMDGLIRLLSSDSFAERLLMDEEGLPKFRDGDNKEAIDSKILAAKPLVAAESDAKDAVELAMDERLEAQTDYNKKYAKWSGYQNDIRIAELAGDPTNSIPGLVILMEEAKEARDIAEQLLEDKKDAYELANDNLEDAKKLAEEARKEVYALYRETSVYKTLIKAIRSSISYSYYKPEDEENLETVARSFIYVNIAVLNNEKLANDLYDQVLAVLPGYVSEAMPKPSGYAATACRQITRLDNVYQVNEGQTLSATIKYGLLLGFVALAIGCVVVVVVDKKRQAKAQ